MMELSDHILYGCCWTIPEQPSYMIAKHISVASWAIEEISIPIHKLNLDDMDLEMLKEIMGTI